MEFDKTSFNNKLSTKLQNCDLKNKLIQALKDRGWTDEEINQINDELDKFGKGITDTTVSPNKEINQEFNQQIEKIVSNQEQIISKTLVANGGVNDSIVKKNNLDFNSPTEVVTVKEPTAIGLSSSPVDIEDAHYTLKQNYPNSYGSINPLGDWYRVDLTSGKVELVHHSGTHLKIDNDGNVTLFAVGSVKWVIDGDFTLNVKGNSDFVTLGDHTNLVGGNNTTMVGGDNKLQVAGNDSTTASKIDHN